MCVYNMSYHRQNPLKLFCLCLILFFAKGKYYYGARKKKCKCIYYTHRKLVNGKKGDFPACSIVLQWSGAEQEEKRQECCGSQESLLSFIQLCPTDFILFFSQPPPPPPTSLQELLLRLQLFVEFVLSPFCVCSADSFFVTVNPILRRSLLPNENCHQNEILN